jgi:hypothetical protein
MVGSDDCCEDALQFFISGIHKALGCIELINVKFVINLGGKDDLVDEMRMELAREMVIILQYL